MKHHALISKVLSKKVSFIQSVVNSQYWCITTAGVNYTLALE